jgi:mono/diheme cytochrome c family protein
MLKRTAITGIIVLLGAFTVSARAADVAAEDLEPRFNDMVLPFTETYCIGCHGGDLPRGHFFMDPYKNYGKVVEGLPIWQEFILRRVSKREMPPKEAEKRPSSEERRKFVAWIESLIEHEAAKKAAAEAAASSQ